MYALKVRCLDGQERFVAYRFEENNKGNIYRLYFLITAKEQTYLLYLANNEAEARVARFDLAREWGINTDDVYLHQMPPIGSGFYENVIKETL